MQKIQNLRTYEIQKNQDIQYTKYKWIKGNTKDTKTKNIQNTKKQDVQNTKYK